MSRWLNKNKRQDFKKNKEERLLRISGEEKLFRQGKRSKVIYHGSCLNCTSQLLNGLEVCKLCQNYAADWSLPDLNTRELPKKSEYRAIDKCMAEAAISVKRTYDLSGFKYPFKQKDTTEAMPWDNMEAKIKYIMDKGNLLPSKTLLETSLEETYTLPKYLAELVVKSANQNKAISAATLENIIAEGLNKFVQLEEKKPRSFCKVKDI